MENYLKPSLIRCDTRRIFRAIYVFKKHVSRNMYGYLRNGYGLQTSYYIDENELNDAYYSSIIQDVMNNFK